jgi:hypothetical protein
MNRKIPLIILILLVVFTGKLSYGNAAAPYQRPDDNILVFDDSTGISLVEEWINFNVMESNYREIQVEVIYLMKNIERKDPKIDIMFLAPYLDENEIEVFFDGEEIKEFTMKRAENIPENWQTSLEMAMIDPITKEDLKSRFGRTDYYTGWSKEGFQFTIAVPKGETKELVIKYKSMSGYYSFDEVVNDIYTQLYYLTPAEFWDGEAIVNIAIEFPADKFEVVSNLPIEKESDKKYTAFLTKIPEEELYFNYVNREGLIFGTNSRVKHNLIAGVIFGVTLIVGIYFIRNKKTIPGILVLLALIPELSLFRPTYGTIFLITIFGPFIAGIAVICFIIRYFRRKKVGL